MTRRWGTGTVQELTSGQWEARLPRSLGRKRLGRYETKREAAAVLAAALAELAREDQMTVDTWGRQWLGERIEEGRHEDARDQLERWDRRVTGTPLSTLQLTEVTPADVRIWLDGMRLETGKRPAARTASNTLSLLRGAFEAACYAGRLEANPAVGVSLPLETKQKPSKAGKARVTADEFDALMKGAETLPMHQRSILVMMGYQGLSPAEVWPMTWDQIDFDARTISVRHLKRPSRERTLHLLEPARAVLDAWREESDGQDGKLVWPSRRNGRPHVRRYDAQIDRAVAAAGLEGRGITLGSLRTTCGSLLLTGAWVERGLLTRRLTMLEVSRWLGHSSIGVTQRHYARILDEEVRDGLVAAPTVPTSVPTSPANTPEKPSTEIAKSPGKSKAFRLADSRGLEPLTPGSVDRAEKGLSSTIPGPDPLKWVRSMGRVTHLARSFREAVAARDPFAVHRGLELCDAVDELGAVAGVADDESEVG